MAVPRAIYVHLPFCLKKCAYCDFLSFPATTETRKRYVDRLLQELSIKAAGWRPRTLYVGGGTPTSIGPELMGQLLEGFRRILDLSGLREFTVEANPATVDDAMVQVLMASPVDRISLGAQSFQAETLAVLGRLHGPADVVHAAGLFKSRGLENLSLDLIYGVPGQTVEMALADVSCALQVEPRHVSAYCLSVHEGTPLERELTAGRLTLVSDEAQKTMYGAISRTLARANFRHYEISNFALPGFHSKHNLVYWRNEPYLGIGLGAVSYDGRTRSTNTRKMEDYLDGRFDPEQAETLSDRRRAQETLIMALRLLRGISQQDFLRRTGFELSTFMNAEVLRFVESGHLLFSEGRLRLARKSLFVADEILQAFLD